MGTISTCAGVRAVRLLVRGTVQGVGFRPFVFRLAAACGVTGFVENRPDGVRILAEGEAGALAAFRARLVAEHPPAARIVRVTARKVPAAGHAAFVIAPSRERGRVLSSIPPDIATCPACMAETDDPGDRRHRYAFTNCTACGPRFTITARLPYDRGNTSMAPFLLCADCGREYGDPSDRRFHAEPVACPACGPALRLADADGTPIATVDPVETAAIALKEGLVLALRGLGGFQLACDATNETAVGELRLRKRRGEKPFAVMVRDLGEAGRLARVSTAEAAILASPQAPVVLCEPVKPAPLAPSVAPGIGRIGLFLPYTPLHRMLILAAGRPLVMTSGNRSEEPIAIANDEAISRLSGIADRFLLHDREVLRRTDDSVVASVGGKPYPIRRARGFVPAPVPLAPRHVRAFRPAMRGRLVAGLGGEMKNTFCFLSGESAILSQHVGDLSDVGARDFWRDEFDFFRRFLGAEVAAVCHDLHPAYFTTGLAGDAAPGCPAYPLQHHEAHLYSLIAESGFTGKAVGIAFDGTGYGTDGAVWGGECFAIDGFGMRRVARLRPFPLQGGDAAARTPWKSALSLLLASFPRAEAERIACRMMPEVPPGNIALSGEATALGVNAIACSSAGRLFDGASALCGLGPFASFEGQAAMRLEALAGRRARGDGGYPYSLRPEGPLLAIDWRDAIAGLVDDRERRVPPAKIARRFHETVASMILGVAERLSSETGARHVLLSGGVFQNLLLLGRLLEGLRTLKLVPVIHRQVPCNDGGIALGQAFYAAIELSRR
jgi:hydrogenase maturation protein HypF